MRAARMTTADGAVVAGFGAFCVRVQVGRQRSRRSARARLKEKPDRIVTVTPLL